MNCDDKINGRETRGILCDVCGNVIDVARIDEIEKHIMSLEFEVRREMDSDRDETAKSIDYYQRVLKKLKCHT